MDWISENDLAMNALHVLEILFCIVGIPIAIVRLIEPYVWREFHYQGHIIGEKIIQMCERIALFFSNCCFGTKRGRKSSLKFQEKLK